MHFSVPAVVASLALLASAAALPQPFSAVATQADFDIIQDTESSKIEKRTIGGVFICTDTNWKGTCGYAVQPLNQCISLDFPWYHSISSFGPDPQTACDWYSDYSCKNTIVTRVGNPGFSDMTNFYNDQIGSFKCYKST